jgi:hypothetical protein
MKRLAVSKERANGRLFSKATKKMIEEKILKKKSPARGDDTVLRLGKGKHVQEMQKENETKKRKGEDGKHTSSPEMHSQREERPSRERSSRLFVCFLFSFLFSFFLILFVTSYKNLQIKFGVLYKVWRLSHFLFFEESI